MSLNLLVDIAMIVAGFAVIITPLWRRLARIERGVVTIWRVVLGEPAGDGRTATPGVMDRLAAQDTELAAIRAELAARNEKGGDGGQ